ncbi:hypothetical protein BH23ACT6_BH23ACT6_11110 [soil metagenome]
MTVIASSALLDEASRVRLAAATLASAIWAVNSTAVQVHSQWLSLHAAYRAPEADIVLRAMDPPRASAAHLLESGGLAQGALLQYADRLGDLARWPRATAAERSAIHQARQAAEWACAAALESIRRPAGRMAGTRRAVLGPLWNYTRADSWVPPYAPQSHAPRCEPAGDPWRHPDESADGGLSRFVEQWAGLAPPDADDPTSHALYAFSMLGFVGATRADWMITIEYGTFRPRGANGRPVPVSSLGTAQRFAAGAGSVSTKEGLTTTQRLKTFTPGGTFEAKGHKGAQHKHWAKSATRWGRANTAVTVASTGWATWQDNSGHPTDRRIGRTVTQTAAVAGGAVAGGQAGALVGSAIGTAIVPGAGTLVGATVGGLVGGFAGSELGGWVGDQVADVGEEAGDLIGDSLDWVGNHSLAAGADLAGTDLFDTVTFWD